MARLALMCAVVLCACTGTTEETDALVPPPLDVRESATTSAVWFNRGAFRTRNGPWAGGKVQGVASDGLHHLILWGPDFQTSPYLYYPSVYGERLNSQLSLTDVATRAFPHFGLDVAPDVSGFGNAFDRHGFRVLWKDVEEVNGQPVEGLYLAQLRTGDLSFRGGDRTDRDQPVSRGLNYGSPRLVSRISPNPTRFVVAWKGVAPSPLGIRAVFEMPTFASPAGPTLDVTGNRDVQKFFVSAGTLSTHFIWSELEAGRTVWYARNYNTSVVGGQLGPIVRLLSDPVALIEVETVSAGGTAGPDIIVVGTSEAAGPNANYVPKLRFYRDTMAPANLQRTLVLNSVADAAAPFDVRHVQVVWDALRFATYWRRSGNPSATVSVQAYDAAGAVLNTNYSGVSGVDYSAGPILGAAGSTVVGGRSVIAWSGGFDAGNVPYRAVRNNAVFGGLAFANAQRQPVVAQVAGVPVVGWLDNVNDPTRSGLRMSTRPNPILDPTGPFTLAPPSSDVRRVSLAARPAESVWVWLQTAGLFGGAGDALVTTRMDNIGQQTAGTYALVTGVPGAQGRVACEAAATGRCLFVYTVATGNPVRYPVNAILFDGVRVISRRVLQDQADPDVGPPEVIFANNQYFVVWSTPQVFGQRLGADGVPIGVAAVLSDDAGGRFASATWDGQGYAVLWSGAQLRARRFDANGAPLAASLAPPIGTPGARIVWTGQDHMLAFTTALTNPTRPTVRMKRLDRNLAVIGDPAPINFFLNEPKFIRDQVLGRTSLITTDLASDGNGAALMVTTQLDEAPFVGLVIDLPRAIGQNCSIHTDCVTGWCADSVCCDVQCGGSDTRDCQACSVNAGAAQNGQCAVVAANWACRSGFQPCDATEVCDGVSPVCPPDLFRLAGTECRAAAGTCDRVEVCDGLVRTCPSDAFQPPNFNCRPVAGACDLAEVCAGGTAQCPEDRFVAAQTTCRISAGVCDQPEVCPGSAAGCPADAFAGAETQCRAAAGPCDAAEVCTGAEVVCPPDAARPVGAECRASLGRCDPPETCDGEASGCPPDARLQIGAECRPSAGACDATEVCDGIGVACPVDGLVSAGIECRAPAGLCDVAETCDGAASDCPPDTVRPAGIECRPSVGDCDPAEACDGSMPECLSDARRPAGSECRASAGDCDPAETCDGDGVSCPPDALRPAGNECRTSAGDCDPAEACDGVEPTCPDDALRPAGYACRASTGACDATDECDGIEPSCPPDVLQPAGAECRAPVGACDQAEACDGVASACPQDAVHRLGVECRSSAGGCDPAEACDGLEPGCPPDRLHALGSECRASAGDCDPAESCDGLAADCPGDLLRAAGAVCSAAMCDDGIATPAVACTGVHVACPPAQSRACGLYVCGAYACLTACDAGTDCTAAAFCDSGNCAPLRADGEACEGPAACESGACVDGVCCDGVCVGQCEACDVAGAEGTCTPVMGPPHGMRPGCDSDGGACGGACDGVQGGSCAYPGAERRCREAGCVDGSATPSADCDGRGACPAELRQPCAPFLCGADACDGDCENDRECVAGSFCSAGICAPKRSQGEPCDGDRTCVAGPCVDGHCCDGPCDGPCEACDVLGFEGACVPVPIGPPRDGHAPCAGSGACVGACDGQHGGACAYPSEETRCVEPTCDEGHATPAAVCDGAGLCVGAEGTSCGAYACVGDACRNRCDGDLDCSRGFHCDAGQCVRLKGDGEGCGAPGECTSGRCVDAVCCDDPCGGQCEACDVPGVEGTCTPVEGAPHSARPACASYGSACGGRCDGVRGDACVYPGAALACRVGTCAGDVATLAATCDGRGACPDPSTQPCAPFRCGDETCAGDCDADDDCQPTDFCSGGVCVPRRNLGEPCIAAGDCSARPCVDGFCCDAACEGACEACDIPGVEGRCSPVVGAPHGARVPCAGEAPCAGRCDGARRDVCTWPGGEMLCAPSACRDGVATNGSVCDGAGTCRGAPGRPCGDYNCGVDACLDRCAGDADCSAGRVCLDGTCRWPPASDAGMPPPDASSPPLTDAEASPSADRGVPPPADAEVAGATDVLTEDARAKPVDGPGSVPDAESGSTDGAPPAVDVVRPRRDLTSAPDSVDLSSTDAAENLLDVLETPNGDSLSGSAKVGDGCSCRAAASSPGVDWLTWGLILVGGGRWRRRSSARLGRDGEVQGRRPPGRRRRSAFAPLGAPTGTPRRPPEDLALGDVHQLGRDKGSAHRGSASDTSRAEGRLGLIVLVVMAARVDRVRT